MSSKRANALYVEFILSCAPQVGLLWDLDHILDRFTVLQEITRRVNLEDIWQAAYTAGVVLPKPVTTCRYYHRY